MKVVFFINGVLLRKGLNGYLYEKYHGPTRVHREGGEAFLR